MRRPSLDSLVAKIARLERTVARGKLAESKLTLLRNSVDSVKANTEARLAAKRAEVAALESQLKPAAPESAPVAVPAESAVSA